jgi:hypothetical protein
MSFIKCRLKTAPGNAILKVHENAFLVIDAGRCVTAGRSLVQSKGLDRADILFAQVPFDNGVGFFYLEDFIIFQRSSSTSLDTTAGTFTLLQIAAKRGLANGVIDDCLADHEHLCPLK